MVYDTHTYLCCQLSPSELIYIIQLEIHKNTSYFSSNTDAEMGKSNALALI
jgi:hypothetical protein